MTNNRLPWLFLVVMAMIVRPAAAQEPPTVQQLIDTAHRVSDLGNLRPYTLTANVVVDNDDPKTRRTGRLTLYRDRGRTREELEMGGTREVRIVLRGKEYIVPPHGLLPALTLTDIERSWDPGSFMASRFNGVRPDKVEGADAWCLTRQSGPNSPASCFDAVKGVYLGYIPNQRMSHEFFDFTSVESGDKQIFYPRRAVILRDDFGRIEVNSIEIKPGAAKDDLFTLPDSAIEIGRCGPEGVAKPIYAPEPEFPAGERAQKIQGVVYTSVIVDKEGKALSVQVLRAPTESLARQAVATINKWKFQPAMCGGQPVYQETSIQIDFHLY
jgi:TonB family protein